MRRIACLLALVPALAAAYPPAVPSTLVMNVRETAGVARTNEVVRSGVPLARVLDVRSTAGLAVVDAGGAPVPAELEVLARWDAGRTADAPIQWLLVTFPATVGAGGSATYRLVTDGSVANPAPAAPLVLTQNGSQVTVATGAATFVLGSTHALFDSVSRAGGGAVVTGGALTARAESVDVAHDAVRRVFVEHSGPLSAVVVVEGTYGLAPVGGGGLSSRRRYTFFRGSPTALVRHSVAWEGDRCGMGNLTCGAVVNGLLLERVRDTLDLASSAPLAVTAYGAGAAAPLAGTAGAGQQAWVRQLLRGARTAPLSYDVAVPGTAGMTGVKADGALLCASGSAGAVAIALKQMHRYEPQALRLLADGRLAVDVADGTSWLGARQGLFATLAVAALPPSPTDADLKRLVKAPLERPLRAWADPVWLASSDAVPEFPVGTITPDFSSYDTVFSGALTRTLQKVDELGLAGLQTFGLFPRGWGDPLNSDEVDCDGNDPTPADDWDDPYWCATWTDYHNAAAAAPMRAFRSGEVHLLDEIAEPAALRMLHTQIFQCAPGDPYFYCGQAPSGYGGYRADNNGSHAYLDNLLLHYWLTGDRTVVETLTRGASTMRDYLCSKRPASACLASDPPADFWAQLVGRVAMQWNAAFRFVGLAEDASYLEDHRANLARAVTQHYAQPSQSGTAYGFLTPGATPVTGAGTWPNDQLWMVSLYDMEMLDRLRRDTGDAPIGSPALVPSGVTTAWARTLKDFGATVAPGGDGTANGAWPNALGFTFTGARVGGTLTSVTPDLSGSDPNLYDTGKATLCAVVVRAAQATGDAGLLSLGRGLTLAALDAAVSRSLPLSKVFAEYVARVHSAVARLGETAAPAAARLRTLTPCRAVDTREPAGPLGGPAIDAPRTFTLAGSCGIPSGAIAVAANVTAVEAAADGALVLHAAGTTPPLASTISFRAGRTRANNAFLPLSGGGVAVQPEIPNGASVHLLIDVSGYFE